MAFDRVLNMPPGPASDAMVPPKGAIASSPPGEPPPPVTAPARDGEWARGTAALPAVDGWP